MAALDNASASEIDKTSFWWTGLCAICHPGGGPTEFDRDGHLYYDVVTDTFGYEAEGKTAADVLLSGDYAEVSHMTGALRAAPWDKTGVAEPDCLLCHRAGAPIAPDGKYMPWVWRTATLRAKDKLVDTSTAPVPAFAAASTAAQGWGTVALAAGLPPGTPPLATSLDVDYGLGVVGGSLEEQADDTLKVAATAIRGTPADTACWGCHITPDLKKRGRVWFDPDKDVHYAGFNHLADADPTNDVPSAESQACTTCHPAGMDHNIAKGNATLGSVRNDTDYVGFLTCRQCHTGPTRHPDAPEPSGGLHTSLHLAAMSCEFCHIPYKHDGADLAIDNASTGSTIGYGTATYLSEDPLDPMATGDGRWWPSFTLKRDADGVERLFPAKLLLSAWWGDWDQNGTPGLLSDDVIRPIALWRVRQITMGSVLPGVNDDNADGKAEVNTLAEIAAYIAALQGQDSHGNPVALNPVLVKGGLVYYDAGMGVGHFAYEGTGIKAESSHPFSINHNVLPASEALGHVGCGECHKAFNGGSDTPVFDRLILVDPYDETGLPVYEKVRDLLPPAAAGLIPD